MKEQGIQTKITKYLEKEGYIVVNMIKTNKNGIPDLQILIGGGKHFWIEVKKLDGKESKLQQYRRKEFIKNGDISIVVYNFNDFLEQYSEILCKYNTFFNN